MPFSIIHHPVVRTVKLYVGDTLHFIFPKNCVTCYRSLYTHEPIVCHYCLSSLPATDFHLTPDNPVEKIFWGRVPLGAATALFYFRSGGMVQKLIHALKYQSRPEIGVELGKIFGRPLCENPIFVGADYIIPVPMHDKKMRERGYNQSAEIAKGLSESMQIPLREDLLVKHQATDSQTRKTRLLRWTNVHSVFSVPKPDLVKGKAVLLVDDVVTTGATIESCAKALWDAGAGNVSLVTLAHTL